MKVWLNTQHLIYVLAFVYWNIVYCKCQKHGFECFPIYHRRTSTQKSLTPRTSQIPQPASSTTKSQFAATSRAHKHAAGKSQVPNIVNWIDWSQERVFDYLLCVLQSWHESLVLGKTATCTCSDWHSDIISLVIVQDRNCGSYMHVTKLMFDGGFGTVREILDRLKALSRPCGWGMHMTICTFCIKTTTYTVWHYFAYQLYFVFYGN